MILIKDFPLEIQQLVHQRQMEQGNDGTFDGDMSISRSDGNFDWNKTPEEDFWTNLHSDGIEGILNHPSYPKFLHPEMY